MVTDNKAAHAPTVFAGFIRKVRTFLASTRLALVLLVFILVSCVVGVTVFRGARAWELVFSTLWFNGLLVLLVVNITFSFFPRMRGRKMTTVSLGMILFHVSFVAILIGILYNSMFYFRGSIRLTEGETLASSAPESYDYIEKGRFFDFAKLKGETTLVTMHRGYEVGGQNKRVAYEISVGEGQSKEQGIIYTTQSLKHDGFEYFRDKEGYSVLVILYDRQGKELFGLHVPLQSIKQKNRSYLYTTGTKSGPESFPFPPDPIHAQMQLQTIYRPSPLRGHERNGEAEFRMWPVQQKTADMQNPHAKGIAAVGKKAKLGEYQLEAREIRYWVGMNVRYEPGKPVVLLSLWVALAGMIMTFVGRMMKGSS